MKEGWILSVRVFWMTTVRCSSGARAPLPPRVRSPMVSLHATAYPNDVVKLLARRETPTLVMKIVTDSRGVFFRLATMTRD